MAVVGEAHIVVRALTSRVSEDIRKGFDGVRGDIAARTGADLGEKFAAGFNKNANQNIFTRIAEGIRSIAPAGDAARLKLNALIKTGYKATVGFGLIAGAIGALIGGLGALIGAAGGAAASLTALVGTMVSLKVGSSLAGFAMKGVGEAVSSAGQASNAGAKSVKELREEMQQLRFEAEEAALAEEEFGLRLEQARESLARTADLPVNSMARREAELNFKQAELAYRQAKDRTKDLNDEVKKGVKSGAAVGGADPFAGLTASQKKFAQFLIGLKPIIGDLRERVAKGFLPELEKQLKRILDSDLLGIVKKGYEGIGDALGEAVKGFTGQILNPDNLESLGNVFEDIEYVVGSFGKTFGKFFRIFIKLLDASGPLIREFSDYLDDLATEFLTFLDGFSNKELENFFTRAGDIAGKFGEIFSNIFDGLGAIIAANFGPGTGGDMLLDFLIESTEGFANLGDDAEGLEKYFRDTSANLITILDGIGGIFTGLAALGQNPAIGEFFDRIKDAGPSIGNIADKGLAALPTVADLVVEFADLVDLLTDSGAISIFFGVIETAVREIGELLKNEWVANTLIFLGQVKAITLGLGVLKEAFSLLTLGVASNLGTLVGGLGKAATTAGVEILGLKSYFGQVGGAIKNSGKIFARTWNPATTTQVLARGFSKVTVETGFLGKSLGILSRVFLGNPILLAITLIVGALAFLYANNEQFRKSFEPFMASIGGLFSEIMVAIQPLMDAFKELYEDHIAPLLFGPNGNDGLVSGLSFVISTILPELVRMFSDFLIPIINVVVSAISNALQFVGDFFEGIKTMFMSIGLLFSGDFIGFMKMGIGGFVMTIMSIVDLVANFVVTVINFVIEKINQLLAMLAGTDLGKFVKDTFGIDLGVGIALIPKANFSAQVGQALGLTTGVGGKNSGGGGGGAPATRMAEGGIVSPSGGGIMAMIAEAGRPERVEPLDPDGLSKRDKAMIQFLTGGTAGAINITVNPSAGMDEKELAAVVSRRLAYELRRGATA